MNNRIPEQWMQGDLLPLVQMLQQDYIKREENPKDRREKMITPTRMIPSSQYKQNPQFFLFAMVTVKYHAYKRIPKATIPKVKKMKKSIFLSMSLLNWKRKSIVVKRDRQSILAKIL